LTRNEPQARAPKAAEGTRYRVTTVTVRQTLCVVLSTVLTVAVVAATSSFATAGTSGSATNIAPVAGKQLYRKYCGQCHALAQALSAGFGNNKNGLGKDGGPSFNELRVPYAYSVNAVKEPTGGHEAVRTKISSKQLSTVATWVARVTNHNPIPALPTDG
jgi:mono/diheme cytochrome c family protein